MATAADIINRAFSYIGVRASETPLEAAEIQDGLDSLNDLLAAWDATGTLKGGAPVLSTTDTLNIPRYAEGALKYALAAMLAGEYQVALSPAIVASGQMMMNEMVKASMNLKVEYPSTLPLGSGNQTDAEDFGVFFPDNTSDNF